jgi:hypothetical protein
MFSGEGTTNRQETRAANSSGGTGGIIGDLAASVGDISASFGGSAESGAGNFNIGGLSFSAGTTKKEWLMFGGIAVLGLIVYKSLNRKRSKK